MLCYKSRQRDVAQLGSAPALGAGCRRFKSCHPDLKITTVKFDVILEITLNYYLYLKLLGLTA